MKKMGKIEIERNYDDNGNLTSKTCSKCGKVKDVSEFGKRKNVPDGLKSNCKSCAKGSIKKCLERKTPEGKEKWDKQWKEELKAMTEEEINQFFIKNMIRITERDKVLIKRCQGCMEYKMVEDFGMKKTTVDKIRNRCKECEVKRDKEYRQTPEGKEVSRRKRHKRRTLKEGNGGSYTSEQWNQCLDYFNHCDAYTGEPLTTTEIEHIIPVNKGGTTYIYNLVPANMSTNRSKGKKDPWEWYSKQPYFSWERYLKICMWVIKNGGASKDINIKG